MAGGTEDASKIEEVDDDEADETGLVRPGALHSHLPPASPHCSAARSPPHPPTPSPHPPRSSGWSLLRCGTKEMTCRWTG